MAAPSMTCQQWIDILMDYLDGALPDDARALFDEHLEDCADCASYLDSYRETLDILKMVAADPQATVPEDVPEALLAAVMAARERTR